MHDAVHVSVHVCIYTVRLTCPFDTPNHRHTRTNIQLFAHYELEKSAELGGIQTAIIQARESANSTTPEERLLDRDSTLFSESSSEPQTLCDSPFCLWSQWKRRGKTPTGANLIGCKTRVLDCVGGKEKEVSEGTAMWCITVPIVMASSEAGMMVHGYIFKGVWEAVFFFPNRMKCCFSSHTCSL